MLSPFSLVRFVNETAAETAADVYLVHTVNSSLVAQYGTTFNSISYYYTHILEIQNNNQYILPVPPSAADEFANALAKYHDGNCAKSRKKKLKIVNCTQVPPPTRYSRPPKSEEHLHYEVCSGN